MSFQIISDNMDPHSPWLNSLSLVEHCSGSPQSENTLAVYHCHKILVLIPLSQILILQSSKVILFCHLEELSNLLKFHEGVFGLDYRGHCCNGPESSPLMALWC